MITQQDIDAARVTMKACQRGFLRHMIDESNNLHAECYGTIGKLLKDHEDVQGRVRSVLLKHVSDTLARQEIYNEIFPQTEPRPERYPRGWHPDDEKPG